MTLGEMRNLLSERDIQLTKSLGQNFLHDQNQLRRIVSAAELTGTDRVLEIGPGLGPLTEHLLAHAAQVLAIEKDARLVAILKLRFAGEPKLELLAADALDVVRDHALHWRDWKLVANLPYSVASPILVELAQSPFPPVRLVATLQLEVARRLMAGPGTDDYGLLTLLVQLRFAPRTSFKIPRGCFFPEPDVDSACIVLERRPQELLAPDLQPVFARLVKRALSQRRKMMVKLLRAEWPEEKLAHALNQLQIRPDIRAEKLSLEQFVALTKLLATHG